jgi:hypothetical protein
MAGWRRTSNTRHPTSNIQFSRGGAISGCLIALLSDCLSVAPPTTSTIVKIKSLLLTPLLALAFLPGGCEKAAPGPDEKVLFQAIQDNANAFDRKDVEAVMATIHPKSPGFDANRGIVADMFSKVTLKFVVSDLKVITSSPEEARVSFKQETDKVVGDQMIPLNIVEGVHTLRPDNGKWKIFSTDTTNTRRLEGKPPGTPEATPATPAPAPAAEAAPKPAAPEAKPPASAAPETKPAPDANAQPIPPAPPEKPPQ